MPKDLSRMSAEELGRLFPVIIVAHNPDWSRIFEDEKLLLNKSFGNDFFLSIEHIGSTAIPDICSKPTVDILCQIKDDAAIDSLSDEFSALSYHINHRPDKPPPHLTYVKGYTPQGFQGQAFHVHIRYKGDWDELYFRDYLKLNREAAEEYERLKKELAKRCEFDREGYTEGKTEFVSKIVDIARKHRD